MLTASLPLTDHLNVVQKVSAASRASRTIALGVLIHA